MKKLFVLSAITATVLVFAKCSSTKKTTAAAAPKLSYETDVQTVIMANCSPCHIPAKGGNKKSYDNFARVKADIDEMIHRIELDPGEKGFMPFRKTAKLSDSTIAVFKQWRDDGLLEK